MPYNAVLDKKFSDEAGTSADISTASVFTYTATGGEFSFQDDRLIGADVLLLFRDGINYEETEDTLDVSKQFNFDSDTGTITFPPDPFPALQTGEQVTVLYLSATSEVIVSEPVTRAEAKAWAKIEVTDDDALIDVLITAARQYVEGYLGQSLIQRTVTAIIRNELTEQRLPYGPVGDVVSMNDSGGTEITSSGYTILGEMFKYVKAPRSSYLKVVYTAGYASCPKDFKTAILMQIAWMYQNRGDVERATALSPEAEILLRQYKNRAT